MKRTWTKRLEAKLRELYPILPLVEVAKACKHTPNATKTKAVKLKIAKVVRHNPRSWNAEQKQYLIDNYITKTAREIGEHLGKSKSAVKNMCHTLNLLLPIEVAEKRKTETMFYKGQSPSNKGKTWDEMMSKESQARSRMTTFKKGNLPHNAKDKDGVISIRRDTNTGRRYKFIRVALSKWVMLHVYNWEKLNGKVPKGHILVFKNGDTMNCEPDNMELITLEENMKRNSIHRFPEELKTTIRLVKKLDRKIKKHEK